MSIALLHQLHDETRRLAVAGSGTAPGDFRLKKLIDPLRQAGEKAPVFAKLADAATAVVEAKEQAAPDAVLELLALSTAVRYTQGETGLPGTMEPLGVKVPLARPTDLSSRLLQPIVEVLSRTGGGRYEVVADGYVRDAFRDVRLVHRAVAGLDDPFSEIAELFAKKIIPESFGPGIAPLIRAGYETKGKQGAARRLQLLHKFDPAGTRPLVMDAIENGSKEVRVAALACLGMHSDDVHILVEQASAKAADVRTAAYWELAKTDAVEAVAALTKAMAGKELAAAWKALANGKGPRLLKAILAAFRNELAALYAARDKKAVSESVERLGYLLQAIKDRDDNDSEAVLLDLFKQRDKLAKVKGDTLAGADLNLDVARAMADGSKRVATALAGAHATIEGDALGLAFDAAHRHLPPAEVYDAFSPYFSAKKSGKVISEWVLIHGQRRNQGSSRALPSDPRWLDLAVASEQLDLVRELARPGHAGLDAYLSATFADAVKSPKNVEPLRVVVETMAVARHPEFERSFFAALAAFPGKTYAYATYYYAVLIPRLPKSAIPGLEALAPNLGGAYGKMWADKIEDLRARPDTV